MKFTFVSLLSALVFYSAPAYADDCGPLTVINENLVKSYSLKFTFPDGFALKQNSQQTLVHKKNQWKKYWGTARGATISHASNSQILPGTVLSTNASRSMSMDDEANTAFSSGLTILNLQENQNQVSEIQLHFQPGSNLRIFQVEKLLNAKITCSSANSVYNTH